MSHDRNEHEPVSDRRKDFLRAVTMHVLRLSLASEQEQLRAIANAAHALANELDAPRLAAPQRTVCGRLCGGGCALCSGV